MSLASQVSDLANRVAQEIKTIRGEIAGKAFTETTRLAQKGSIDPDTIAMNAGTLCTIPTYDGSGDVVHPSVVYFARGWQGYPYWMAMTPYPGNNDDFENPSIVASKDGITWVVPPGVTNPIIPFPGGSEYNSDPHLVMDPDGLTMHMYYRQCSTNASPTNDVIRVVSSKDGWKTWTAPTVCLSVSQTTRRILSPAVFYDSGNAEWVMITIHDPATPPRVIHRYTAPAATGPWTSTPTTVSMTPVWPAGRDPWHLDVHYLNGQVVALINDNPSNAQPGGLWLATSEDSGKSFRRSELPINPTASYYRSSLVPLLTDSGFGFEIFAGSLDWVKKSSTFRRVEYEARFGQRMAAVERLQWPYVSGDDFNRANSTTSLGTSVTGQAWTANIGTFGIANKRAYPTTTANTRAWFPGSKDGDIGLLCGNGSAAAEMFLCFRRQDNTNYWRFGLLQGDFVLQKVAGGAIEVWREPCISTSRRFQFRVRLLDSKIECYIDDCKVVEYSSTSLMGSADIGIQAAGDTNVRFYGLYCYINHLWR